MIFDAPLQLPGHCSYAIFGQTGICRRLQEILAVVRPRAEFLGFVDEAGDCSADYLIVCDLAAPGAGGFLSRRDDPKIAIMPLPVGDMWSYWEFSKFALQHLNIDESLTLDEQNWVDVLNEMGRVKADPVSGNPAISNFSYLSTATDLIGQNKDVILEVMQGLSDDASRSRYSLLLTAAPMDHWNRYLARTFANIQYFDYLDFSRCQVVLNGGIFGGYELPFFAAKLPGGASVHNVDPLGHDPLTDYVRPWVESGIVDFVEHRLALSDHDGEIEITVAADGQVSTVNEGRPGLATSTYPCKSIDSLVGELGLGQLDLVKLDLEGADRTALVGAVDTLQRFRPQIALSIYHFFPDFWDIPNFALAACPDYDFYLDFYSFERWETILYGVPKELGHRPTSTAVAVD